MIDSWDATVELILSCVLRAESSLFMAYSHLSVSPYVMCGQRSIYSVNLFSDSEEPSVVHLVGCDVIMIMTPFSVITKAVKVLNAQVQALMDEKIKPTLLPDFHLGLADVYKAADIAMSNMETWHRSWYPWVSGGTDPETGLAVLTCSPMIDLMLCSPIAPRLCSTIPRVI